MFGTRTTVKSFANLQTTLYQQSGHQFRQRARKCADNRCRLKSTATQSSTSENSDDLSSPPFPFLWPSLPSAPDICPNTLTPVITANPKSIWDRFYIAFMTIPVRFPAVNRALNVGWISMLLTRSAFPEKFINGGLLAFEEFLRRLRIGEDTTELLTPEFSKFLYDHLGSTTAPSNLEDGASISNPKDGQITIRDAWLFIGNPSSFAHSLGKFGGLVSSTDTHDPKSKTLFLQLPFTSIVQHSGQDTPLALQVESGLQLAIDLEIKGDFRFSYKGEDMTEKRTVVVRFMSQTFGPKTCVSTEDKNRRIFSIRDNIRWSIADIDYVWSSKNRYEHS